MVDEDYPDKDRIVLVMDNLNTISSSADSLHPQAGSWRMAEIESRQCLDRTRIPDHCLRRELGVVTILGSVDISLLRVIPGK